MMRSSKEAKLSRKPSGFTLGGFQELRVKNICIFHFQTLEVYSKSTMYHVSMYNLNTVKHKHKKYTIYTIQATCSFMETLKTG